MNSSIRSIRAAMLAAVVFAMSCGGLMYTSAPAMACAWTPTVESNYYATSLDHPDYVQVICELRVENIAWDSSYWSSVENRQMPLGHGTAHHARPAGLGGGVDTYPAEIYWEQGKWIVNQLPAAAPPGSATPAPAAPPVVVPPAPVVNSPTAPYIPTPSFDGPNLGCTWVNGYTKKNGKNVRGHWRC